MKFYLSRTLLFGTALGLILSCKPASQKSEDTSNQEVLNKEDITKSLEQVAYPLPEPFEVYNMLNGIGANYMIGILNPVNNIDKYFTDKSKAINIGIYAADLGYSATYKNQEELKKYSLVLKQLIDDLGIRVDYSALQAAEGSSKIANKDSLISLVSDLFYDSYSFLYKESSPSLAGMMAAGAWVEGLYISTHISTQTFDNAEIVSIIYKQNESLNKLIELLSKFKDDERVSSLLGAFNKLKELYESTNGSLTKEQLQSITTTIETIRESMIS